MKVPNTGSLLSPLCVCAAAEAQSPAVAPQAESPYRVAKRGPHDCVLTKVSWQTYQISQVDSATITFTVRNFPSYSSAMSFDPPSNGRAFASNSDQPGNVDHYAVPIHVSADGISPSSGIGSVALMEIYADRAGEGIMVGRRTTPPVSPITAQYTWPFARSGLNELTRLVRDDLGIEMWMGGGNIQVFGGALDTTFVPANISSGTVRAVAVQSDGKILIGGDFTTVGGQSRNRIARLNSDLDVVTQDGGLDTTFTPGTGANGTVNAIAVQSDGGVVIGGTFTSVNGTGRNRIARFNSLGVLDASFNPNVGGGDVHSIVVQPDGKIIIGGAFTTVVGGQATAQPRNRIARLYSDGSLDTAFNPSITGGSSPVVYSIALKLSPIGALENILVGGDFTTVGTQTRNRVARLETGGGLDTSLNTGNGPSATVRAVAVDAKGNIFIGGDFTLVGTSARKRVARFFSDGTLDSSFQNGITDGANAPVHTLAPQQDGRVTIAGEFTAINGTTRNRVGRLNENGTLDETFRPSPTTLLSQHGANGIIRSLVVQWDGLFVIGGDFAAYTVPGQVDNIPQPLSAGPRVARIGGH